jgi:hypothetical protein
MAHYKQRNVHSWNIPRWKAKACKEDVWSDSVWCKIRSEGHTVAMHSAEANISHRAPCQMVLMLFPTQKFAHPADCKKFDECDLLPGTNGAESRCISSVNESETQQLRCKATRRGHFSCRSASLRKADRTQRRRPKGIFRMLLGSNLGRGFGCLYLRFSRVLSDTPRKCRIVP